MPRTLQESTWINASNGKLLAKYKITASRARVDAAMEALYNECISAHRVNGLSPKQAELETTQNYIRTGLNRSGNSVWQIQEKHIADLSNWIVDDAQWISANNYDRLTKHKITSGGDRIGITIAKLYASAINTYEANGFTKQEAEKHVTTSFYRLSHSEQGNHVWQIHEGMLPQLQLELYDSPWINSHNKQAFSEHGMTAITERLDEALAGHYKTLIGILSKTMPSQHARTIVEQKYLRPSQTGYGNTSWEVHEDHMQTVSRIVRNADKRTGGEWMSHTSLRLGISGRPETKKKAMLKVQAERIQYWINQGQDPTSAAIYVKLNEVGIKQGLDGRSTLKIHSSLLDELKKAYTELPHTERYSTRTSSTHER